MRSLRWLLLVALVLVAAAVLGTYNSQRRAQRSSRRPTPPPIGLDTKTAAVDWEWGQSGNGQPQVHITAKSMTQSADNDTALKAQAAVGFRRANRRKLDIRVRRKRARAGVLK